MGFSRLINKQCVDKNRLRICCLILLLLFATPALKAQIMNCPEITSTTTAFTVCSERAIDSLLVTVTGMPSGAIHFVRFDTYQANPYTGSGGVPLGEVLPVNGMATLHTVKFPPHWDATDRLYYVYARLQSEPTDAACTPFALINVYIRANPTASVIVKEATCYGAASQSDGQVSITGYMPTERYEMAVNGTFTGQPGGIPANGVIVHNLSRTGIPQTYSVRITNSLGCYTDRIMTMQNTRCDCLPTRCVPIVISKISGDRRGR